MEVVLGSGVRGQRPRRFDASIVAIEELGVVASSLWPVGKRVQVMMSGWRAIMCEMTFAIWPDETSQAIPAWSGLFLGADTASLDGLEEDRVFS